MSPIPKTAPFAEEEIDLLNRVVGTASPRSAPGLPDSGGLDASGAAVLPHPAAPARPAEPLTIIYCKRSGNSEKLAGDLAKAARKNGLKPTVIDMADLELPALASAKRLVLIAATWGEGEPPARAARAYDELMGEGAPRLEGVEFGVLALGDTAYAEFCVIGRKIDERPLRSAASAPSIASTATSTSPSLAARWIGDAVKVLTPPNAGGRVIEVDFGAKPAASTSTDIVEAEIVEHVDLNSRSDKETIHLALSFEGGAPAYEPGDLLDLYAENDPAYVDELLKIAGLASDEKLRADSSSRASDDPVAQDNRDLCRIHGPSVRQGAARRRPGQGMDRRASAYRFDRDLPDPADAERLRALTRRSRRALIPLPAAPRDRRRGASLISAVRYDRHGRARKGVASNYVADS